MVNYIGHGSGGLRSGDRNGRRMGDDYVEKDKISNSHGDGCQGVKLS